MIKYWLLWLRADCWSGEKAIAIIQVSADGGLDQAGGRGDEVTFEGRSIGFPLRCGGGGISEERSQG